MGLLMGVGGENMGTDEQGVANLRHMESVVITNKKRGLTKISAP